MDKIKTIEESLVKAMDALVEQTDDKTTKILAELFKSAVLKKYKDASDNELPDGIVHKENVDKAFEFCYADACVAVRTLPGISEDEKECIMKDAKMQKGRLKQMMYNILAHKNIEIVD